MMNFEEFNDFIAKHVRNYLPEKYAGTDITLLEVTKDNDRKLIGLSIRMKDSITTPIIYLDQYYMQYGDGRGTDDILRDIADVRTASEMKEHSEMERITDFEFVKDKIICRLVNAEMNKEYLSGKPYKQIEDLAVLYVVDLGDYVAGHMSATVTDSMMEWYGINAQELHEIALRNLSESSIEIKSMRDAIIEITFPDGLPENDSIASVLFPGMDMNPMYVLSNAERWNGAAAVLDRKTMDGIAEKLGGDYVVIPSSVHEVIILPISESTDIQAIDREIQSINAELVVPEERLSDHAYLYDSAAHKLVLMYKRYA